MRQRDTDDRSAGVPRRAVLRGLAVGGGVVVIGGGGYAAGRFTTPASDANSVDNGVPTGVPDPRTYAQWVGARWYMAHRGSGDVIPENSVAGFQAALGWGAQLMEVSVRTTSDGTLIAMHDDTYDRTTTGKGSVAGQPYAYTQGLSLKADDLGPGWTTPALPVPRLDDVLAAVGGRAVLAVEAKDDAAYPAMMNTVSTHGLTSSVLVKVFWSTTARIAAAQTAGFAVFGYFGDATDVTAANIDALAGRLRKGVDYLVLWAYTDAGVLIADDLVQHAVATGHQVWAAAVQRRSHADRLRSLGVTGIVTGNYGYVSRSIGPVTADSWADKKLAPGELTIDPGTDVGLTWTGSDELSLSGRPGQQQFVCLGNLSPLADAHSGYAIDLELKWSTLPADLTQHADLAFGSPDDQYYEHQLGKADGYHALIRATGHLELYAHTKGQLAGQLLGQVIGPALTAGEWVHLKLTVQPNRLVWARTDLDRDVSITATDARFRGAYLHLGRAAPDGVVAVRTLRVS